MLCLGRKKNQIIDIGDTISVEVLGIDRGIVKLGIVAPKDVVVLRRELREKKAALFNPVASAASQTINPVAKQHG